MADLFDGYLLGQQWDEMFGAVSDPRPAYAGLFASLQPIDGEELAARYLAEQGWVVLDRNWRCTHGEIDLVARDGDCLVFCEVKTRRGLGYGSPTEAIAYAKLHRLRQLAAEWISAEWSGRDGGRAGGGAAVPGVVRVRSVSPR